MILDLHPGMRIEKLSIGRERAPLLVVEQFVADPDRLVHRALSRQFSPRGEYYPGIRTEAPLAYQQLFQQKLRSLLLEFFGLVGQAFAFPLCHYSLVTTPADKLRFLQRIPHIDTVASNGLASVHYLFKKDLGGTAFYRHRKTGYEYVDESRSDTYFQAVASEEKSGEAPEAGYINGDTALYEQIGKQDGVFNRLIIYRRNSLHSGCIGSDFIPDPNPLTGRLSINTFIDVLK